MGIKSLLLWITGNTPAKGAERPPADERAPDAATPPPPRPRSLPTGKRLFELEPDDFEFMETRAMVEILKKKRREAKPAWRGEDETSEGKRKRTWREEKNHRASRAYPGDNRPGRHR